MPRALWWPHPGATDVALPLGDFYFYGVGGAGVDVARAAKMYSVAVAAGNPQAAYNLGYLVRAAAQSRSHPVRVVPSIWRTPLSLVSPLCPSWYSTSTVRVTCLAMSRRPSCTTTACWSWPLLVGATSCPCSWRCFGECSAACPPVSARSAEVSCVGRFPRAQPVCSAPSISRMFALCVPLYPHPTHALNQDQGSHMGNQQGPVVALLPSRGCLCAGLGHLLPRRSERPQRLHRVPMGAVVP